MSDFTFVYGAILGSFLKIIEFLIAACVFVLLQQKSDITTDTNWILILFIINSEVFTLIPCYFGDRIYNTSNGFIADLFSCDWNKADVKHKKMIYIFMEYLKTPVSLDVWFHPQLNLQKFTDVREIVTIEFWKLIIFHFLELECCLFIFFCAEKSEKN